jgi:hypothetical protein
MRINYSDDEDFPGQFHIWQANCRRSLRGKKGQAALRRLEAALLAMPEKTLRHGKLVAHDGSVCAIGALARAEGKLPAPEPITGDWEDDDVDDTAEWATDNLDVPKLVAWKVVAQNDITNDVVWELAPGPLNRHEAVYRGPDGTGYGRPHIRPMTGEERYEKMLAWVRANLIETGNQAS